MRIRGNPGLSAAGGALTGLGGTLSVAYWIYTMEASPAKSFWHLPGLIGLGLLAAGAICLLVGIAKSRSEPPRQTQRGGERSTNVQAGGDVQLGRREEESNH